MSACDDEAREKAKDAAKAMEAVAAYGLAGRLTPEARATASGQAPPADVPRFADSGTVSVSPPLAASTWPNAEPVKAARPLR